MLWCHGHDGGVIVTGAPRDTEREEILWRLARCLFEIMEHLNPSPPNGGDADGLYELWEHLGEREKRFYFFSVLKLLDENSDVLRFTVIKSANDHVICGHIEHGE